MPRFLRHLLLGCAVGARFAVSAADADFIVTSTNETEGVTLRAAVAYAAANPSAVRADGSRTITFSLPAGAREVYVTNAIAIPPGVSVGLDGGTNGVVIRAQNITEHWYFTNKTEVARAAATNDTEFYSLMVTNAVHLIEHRGARLELRNLEFTGGIATNETGTGQAGAVTATGPVFASNCVFRANRGFKAGAVSLEIGGTFGSNILGAFDRCTFAENEGSYEFGYYGYAGAVYVSVDARTVFRNCTFVRNTADYAGAVYFSDRYYGDETDAVCLGCTFAGNHATRNDGAGAIDVAGGGGRCRLVNVCVVSNTVNKSGGGTLSRGVVANDNVTLETYYCRFDVRPCDAKGNRLLSDVHQTRSHFNLVALTSDGYSYSYTCDNQDVTGTPEKFLAFDCEPQIQTEGAVRHLYCVPRATDAMLDNAFLVANADWSQTGFFTVITNGTSVSMLIKAFWGSAEEIYEISETDWLCEDQLGAVFYEEGQEDPVLPCGSIGSRIGLNITLDVQGGTLPDPSATNMTFLTGTSLPAIPIPEKTYAVFRGWYAWNAKVSDWVQVYDENGTPAASRWEWGFRDAVLRANWMESDVALTVTTARDDVDPFTAINLAEAVRVLTVYPTLTRSDGRREITFNLAGSSLTLTTNQLCTVTNDWSIDGYNAGRGLTLSSSSGGVLTFAGPDKVTLRNLSICNASDSAVCVETGELVAENCLFAKNMSTDRGGAVYTRAPVSFTRCSFSGQYAATAGGAVALADGATGRFSSCSFTENNSTYGSVLHATGAGGATFELCSFASNNSGTNADVVAEGAVVYDRSLFATNGLACTFFAEDAKIHCHTNHTVPHYFPVPLAVPAVFDVAAASGKTDLLGASDTSGHPCRGAVRSFMKAVYLVDTGAASYYGKAEQTLVCGATMPTDALVGMPVWSGREFKKWDVTYAKVPYTSPFRTKALWTCSPAMLTVNTAEYAENILDKPGVYSLPDALHALADCPELTNAAGERRITFDLPDGSTDLSYNESLWIRPETTAFTLDGRNNGRGLRFLSNLNRTMPFFNHEGASARFVNVSFYGYRHPIAGLGGALRASDGRLEVSNCFFYACQADDGGAIGTTNGYVSARDCCFYGCQATRGGALSLGRGELVNCTFAANVASETGAVLEISPAAERVKLTQCSITSTEEVSNRLAAVHVASGAQAPVQTAVLCADTPEEHRALFLNEEQETELASVTHCWFPPRATPEAVTGGTQDPDELGVRGLWPGKGSIRSVWYVTFTLDPNGGAVDAPTLGFMTSGAPLDSVPLPRRNGWIFLGWYLPDGTTQIYDAEGKRVMTRLQDTTLKAMWRYTTATLTVTTGEDGENLPNGKVTLRDAVKALVESPLLADDEGVRRVRRDATVSAFTLQDSLVIPSGTYPFTIDLEGGTISAGAGLTNSMIVCGDTSLLLQNIAFEPGEVTVNGAAIRTAGYLAAVDCSFSKGSAANGGALAITGDGYVCFRACSFVDSSASGAGGAVWVDDQAYFTALLCTFSGNRSGTLGGAVAAASGADVCLLGCTVAENESPAGGGVYARGTATTVACLFAGNQLSHATNYADMRCEGTWNNLASTLATGATASSASTSTLFLNNGARRTATISGVTQTFYRPASADVAADGRWFWTSAYGESLACAESRTGARTVLRGSSAEAAELVDRDQLWRSIEMNLRGSVMAEVASLYVTTCRDVEDGQDGETSLREALKAALNGMADPEPDGYFNITFDPALSSDGPAVLHFASALPAITTKVRFSGPVEPSVVLSWDAAEPGTLFTCSATGTLVLENLALTSDNSRTDGERRLVYSQAGDVTLSGCVVTNVSWDAGTALVMDGGKFVCECSSFYRNGTATFTRNSGGVFLARGATGRFVNCTFADNVCNGPTTTPGRSHPVEFWNHSDVDIVSTTFAGNRGYYGTVFITREASGKNPGIRFLNALLSDSYSFYDESYRDIWNAIDSPNYVTLYYTVFYLVNTRDRFTLVESDGSYTAETVFTEGLGTQRVQGQVRAYRRVSAAGGAHKAGVWVSHSPDWSTLAYSRYADGTGAVYVRKNDATVTSLVTISDDILGRSVSKDVPTPGSYAAMHDVEACSQFGVVAVTQTIDPGVAVNPYDGYVSLREAVEYAVANPHFRDADGICTITFDPSCFAFGETALTISSVAAQLEVEGFTNGTQLVIRGPTDRTVTLDGAGLHRLFYVAPGNFLRLENLVLSNAVGQAVGGSAGAAATLDGGAVRNAGELEVSNCVFVACQAGDSVGLSRTAGVGGALCTDANATSRVFRCTFDGCRAGGGGAVATHDGGFAAVVCSTFFGNEAFYDNSLERGFGGGVWTEGFASRTLLVNCTLADNHAENSGGAVAAVRNGSREAAPTLYLLNTLAVGNTHDERDGANGGRDLYSSGPATLVHVTYGACNTNAGDWADAAAPETLRAGITAAEVFADISDADRPLPCTVTSNGVPQSVIRILEGVALSRSYVAADERWENVVYGESAFPEQSFFGEHPQRAILGQGGTLLTADQTDGDSGDAFAGATRRTASRAVTPEPIVVDPLQVTNATVYALFAAMNRAATSAYPNPVITFAPDITEIAFDDEIELAAAIFASKELVIRGPVTFRTPNAIATRFFSILEDNHVRFEQITFRGGRADEVGGAVYLNEACFTAVDCAFVENVARDVGSGGFGGAVCSEGETSRLTFERCQFRNNVAEADDDGVSYGHALYHDDFHLTLYDCTFTGELADEICPWELRVALERNGTTMGYFDTTGYALDYAQAGDTLVLLSADCADAAEINLPNGVLLRDDSGALGAVVTAAGNTLRTANAAAGITWYTVYATPAAVRSVLNTNAIPEFAETTYGAQVTVRPANVKPNLFYALGAAADVKGPYAVSEWVRANAQGELPAALTAPRQGANGFYRVIVTDAP